MNLDIGKWEEFRVGELFKIRRGDRIVHDEDYFDCQDDEFRYPVITTTTVNNGVDGFYNQVNCDGNCIVSGGEASGMFTTYQEKPFWGLDTVRIYEPINFVMNKYIGMFLATELTYNMYRFSYGRKAKPDNMYTLDIKLPVDKFGSPDWQFMEDYIKSLHYKPLITENKKGQTPDLDVQNWNEFLLYDYFDVVPGKYHYPEEYEEGITPYYSASNENNGIGSYIDLPPDFEGNKIVTGKVGCTAFYAPEPFCATSDVNIFIPKFNMSQYVGLFIANVINYSENYKWAYGRQCRVGNSKKIAIKLPVDAEGDPDWQFMEDYIKALPYGDRLVV